MLFTPSAFVPIFFNVSQTSVYGGRSASAFYLAQDANAPNLEEEERFPTGPNGRLETRAEYEHRLAINCKMRFHRSLQSSLYDLKIWVMSWKILGHKSDHEASLAQMPCWRKPRGNATVPRCMI